MFVELLLPILSFKSDDTDDDEDVDDEFDVDLIGDVYDAIICIDDDNQMMMICIQRSV